MYISLNIKVILYIVYAMETTSISASTGLNSYRPVSIFIGATPHRNLAIASADLSVLKLLVVTYGSVENSCLKSLYVHNLFLPFPMVHHID